LCVFNPTFSNISAISWQPVLVVEEAEGIDLRILRDGESFISGGREFHNFKVDGRK
jgi:hypothetical protein